MAGPSDFIPTDDPYVSSFLPDLLDFHNHPSIFSLLSDEIPVSYSSSIPTQSNPLHALVPHSVPDFINPICSSQPNPSKRRRVSKPVTENLGFSQNLLQKDLIVTLPNTPKPFLCTCCQVLQEIIHTNTVHFRKLEIHGKVGMIHHGVSYPNAHETTTNYQTFDFTKKSIEEIKLFLAQYCSGQLSMGYFIAPDPLSAYYESLTIGLDWTKDPNPNLGEGTSGLSKTKAVESFKTNSSEQGRRVDYNLRAEQQRRMTETTLQDFSTIPKEIDNLQNLQTLDVKFANLSGHIPPSIFNISTIRDIVFVGNKLQGSLPSNLGFMLPKLERLLLDINYRRGKIPSFLSNATMLSLIDLSVNSFSGNIPDVFGNLPNLEWLSLYDNNLTADPSSSELSIIDSLTGCKYLRRLDLSYNSLNSIHPISIGNLSTSLKVLQVNMCNMRGSIPSSITNLSRLTDLILDDNQLTGTTQPGLVPQEICQLKSLGLLSLTSNRFAGPIPSCLGSQTSFRYLYLGSNKFNLTIPSTLWSLSDLLFLDNIFNLSSNELRGTLPSEISNLKFVIELYLENNQFVGHIPSSLGGLQYLTNLSLANNEFEGPIPDSFGSLVSLEFFDLSENNISGVIPKLLEALKHLRSFNVSFNRLEGQIPTGGPFANFSVKSFTGNELLCGAPYLGFPECKVATSDKISKSIAIVIKYILPVTIVTVIILIIVYVSIKCKKQAKQPDLEVDSTVATCRRISLHELQQATNGFSDVNLLGIGSFGKVYKGILSARLHVAIKVFNLEQEGAFKSFDAECEVFCNVRHRNLTKIISNCSNIDFKALVLSYMPNGSLEKWLHSHNHSLSLIQTLNIMIDVAEAVDYLHRGCSIPIVRCDLKPSNVLLDDDMVAHVTDFGIAKLLNGGDSVTQTMTLATMGYMAPEYGLEGAVSKRGDVYSYGILIVETFMQKKPTDEMFQGEFNIIEWVKESYSDTVIDIVDAKLLTNEERQFAIKKKLHNIYHGIVFGMLKGITP